MKKSSSELKREVKASLAGRWKDAILLNIIPSVLTIIRMWLIVLVFGAMSLFAWSFISNTSESDTSVQSTLVQEDELGDLEDLLADSDMLESDDYLSDDSDTAPVSTGYTFGQGLLSVVLGLIGLGISYTLLDMLRNPNRKVSVIKDSFRVFNGKDFVPVFLIGLLETVFIMLWTLLLIVPGIIKAYAYSQSFFIYKDLSEKVGMENQSAVNYISESRKLMTGNKGRLFYIDLSFIGWHLLAILTLGLGYLVLNPYIAATKAAFYRDISEDKYALDASSII